METAAPPPVQAPTMGDSPTMAVNLVKAVTAPVERQAAASDESSSPPEAEARVVREEIKLSISTEVRDENPIEEGQDEPDPEAEEPAAEPAAEVVESVAKKDAKSSKRSKSRSRSKSASKSRGGRSKSKSGRSRSRSRSAKEPSFSKKVMEAAGIITVETKSSKTRSSSKGRSSSKTRSRSKLATRKHIKLGSLGGKQSSSKPLDKPTKEIDPMSSMGVSTGVTAAASKKTDVDVGLAKTAPEAADEGSVKSTKSIHSVKSVLSRKSNESSNEQAADKPSTGVETAVISIPDAVEAIPMSHIKDIEAVKVQACTIERPTSLWSRFTRAIREPCAPSLMELSAEGNQEAATEVSSVVSGKAAPAYDASVTPSVAASVAKSVQDVVNEVGKAFTGIAADIGLPPAKDMADEPEKEKPVEEKPVEEKLKEEELKEEELKEKKPPVEEKPVEETNIDELMDDAAALIKETCEHSVHDDKSQKSDKPPKGMFSLFAKKDTAGKKSADKKGAKLAALKGSLEISRHERMDLEKKIKYGEELQQAKIQAEIARLKMEEAKCAQAIAAYELEAVTSRERAKTVLQDLQKEREIKAKADAAAVEAARASEQAKSALKAWEESQAKSAAAAESALKAWNESIKAAP